MKLRKLWENLPGWARVVMPGMVAVALTACAGGTPALPLPQADASGQPILAAGDVAIAGQEAAHSIMDLPEVNDAKVPPLVRFDGVHSRLAQPIDTEPYTGLLRDRLLLITREKLRFVEHTLPPLHGHKTGSSAEGQGGADYAVTATLSADATPTSYLIRIQFVELHSGNSVFSGLYRINPEEESAPSSAGGGAPGTSSIESTAPMPSGNGSYASPSAPSTSVNIQ
jgi:hypothetical protein